MPIGPHALPIICAVECKRELAPPLPVSHNDRPSRAAQGSFISKYDDRMQDMSTSAVSALRGADAQLREELVAYLRPTVCLTIPNAHGDAICSIELTGKGQR